MQEIILILAISMVVIMSIVVSTVTSNGNLSFIIGFRSGGQVTEEMPE